MRPGFTYRSSRRNTVKWLSKEIKKPFIEVWQRYKLVNGDWKRFEKDTATNV